MCVPRRLPLAVASLAALLAGLPACGPTTAEDPGDAGGGHDAAGDDGGWTPFDAAGSDAVPGFVGAVYAHSATELHRIDPDTLEVTLVGQFAWPGGSDQMTDIALDKDAAMVGISFDTFYAVNKDTAACTRIASLDRADFNGLSFIPGEEVGSGEEILVASAQSGDLYRVDKTTGASTRIGDYGGMMSSSGDVVSVRGFGTVATVLRGLGGTDWIARIDPTTGVATLIGDTGESDIWGLGFWKDKVYGFTEGGRFVLVDVDTGDAQVVTAGSVTWWGAGVTTSAPYIE